MKNMLHTFHRELSWIINNVHVHANWSHSLRLSRAIELIWMALNQLFRNELSYPWKLNGTWTFEWLWYWDINSSMNMQLNVPKTLSEWTLHMNHKYFTPLYSTYVEVLHRSLENHWNLYSFLKIHYQICV